MAQVEIFEVVSLKLFVELCQARRQRQCIRVHRDEDQSVENLRTKFWQADRNATHFRNRRRLVHRWRPDELSVETVDPIVVWADKPARVKALTRRRRLGK